MLELPTINGQIVAVEGLFFSICEVSDDNMFIECAIVSSNNNLLKVSGLRDINADLLPREWNVCRICLKKDIYIACIASTRQ